MLSSDCIIVGAGPAGLTAAIYLARFRRRVTVFNSASSRAALIPLSHNVPGYSDDVNGQSLLNQMRKQATTLGVPVIHAEVKQLEKVEEHFIVHCDQPAIASRTILATGIADNAPPFLDMNAATKEGYRHCPICDAYEIIDKKVAVLSNTEKAVHEAKFLSTYTNDITLLTLGQALDLTVQTALSKLNIDINIITDAIFGVARKSNRIYGVKTKDGNILSFDALYNALGCRPQSRLGQALGTATDEDGALLVDKHCQTSVPGLYAVGDVCSSLNQIAVALGHGAIAATAVHNKLNTISTKSF